MMENLVQKYHLFAVQGLQGDTERGQCFCWSQQEAGDALPQISADIPLEDTP